MPRPYVLFCLYIAILILLPGGTIFGLNFKMLVFAPLVVFAVLDVLTRNEGLRHIAISTAIIATTALWILIAQVYSFYDIGLSCSQYKDIVSTFIGCWLVRLFTRSQKDRDQFIRLCLYGTTFLGFAKVALFLYCMLTGTPISLVLDSLSAMFSVKLMTFDLAEALGRIQFPSDTLVPVCLFTILCLRKRLNIHPVTSLLMVFFLIASAMFSFSRFLYGFTALAALLGILVSQRDKLHWLYLSISTAIAGYYFTTIALLFRIRFSQQVVDASDGERILQSSALQRSFFDAPFFGHGLGTFTNVVIRQPDLPYNYEMQLLALSTQVGIVGMVLLVSLLFNYYRKAFTFTRGHRAYQSAVLLLLIAFLAGALFNPSVLSSIAAATYGLIFALASSGVSAEKTKVTSRSMKVDKADDQSFCALSSVRTR